MKCLYGSSITKELNIKSSSYHLAVDGLVIGCHGSFLDSFRKGWMSMAGACNIFTRSSVFHSQHALRDQLSCICSHDVNTKNFISLFVSQELHDAVSLIYCPRTAVCHHTEFTSLEFHSSLLELFFCLPNPGDLWVSVDNGRDGVVVDVAYFASNVLDTCDSVLFCLVGEHRTWNGVSNGMNAWDVGLEFVIYQHPAAIHLDSHVFESKSTCEGPPSNSHQDDVGIKCLCVSSLAWLHGQIHTTVTCFRTRDLVGQPDLDTLLLHDTLKVSSDFMVHGRHDVWQEFDHFDFGAKPRPHGA
mmetsp:Transcript_14377/g.41066  ORF Transcript_14377/g.41066 Transcript_14377/m.41066 type:complete len:300 (-) Transcript_14377:747-1646(-)